jgi:serine/threonine protein kinase
MEDSFLSTVDAILASNETKVGPIAVRMIEILQQFHSTNHILVDVKPENFMLASSSASSSKALVTNLAQRLRCLDLGLVLYFLDERGKHAPDTGGSLQGTPLYLSLHAHEGSTPSRRDDVFAMGLVLIEWMFRLQAGIKAKTTTTSRNLPWAAQSSDDAIGRVKKEQVTNRQSELYKSLPPAMGDIFHQFLSQAHELKYAAEPDYAAFAKLVQGLELSRPVAVAAKKATTRRKQSAAEAPPSDDPSPDSERRTTRSGTRFGVFSSSSPESEGSPVKMRKIRSSTAVDEDGDQVMIDVENEEDENKEMDEFLDAQSGDDADWVHVDKKKETACSDTEMGGVGKEMGGKLDVVQGPHMGESLLIFPGKTVIVGANPKTKKNETAWKLEGLVDDSHAKLDLSITKSGTLSVSVTNLCNSLTYCRGPAVDKLSMSQSSIVCREGTIQLGETILKVKQWSADRSTRVKKEAVVEVDEPKASKSRAKDDAAMSSSTAKASSGQSAVIVVKAGPHKGLKQAFDVSGTKAIVVGSHPTASSSHLMKLTEDENVENSHVRLEMAFSKGYLKMKVTDLKSHSGTFVDGKRLDKGKSIMFFRNQEITIGDSSFSVLPL